MEWDTNDLRALAGGIILVLAIISLILKTETETLKYILIALASFLVGGQLISKENIAKTNE
jgi:hypothetical protein